MNTAEQILRSITVGDPAFFQVLVAADQGEAAHGLDARSAALVRLGALIGAGSAAPVWRQAVGHALGAGLSFDEIVGSLVVLAPTIGFDRVVAAAPELAAALGYDVDAALFDWPGVTPETEARATRDPADTSPTEAP
jgi:alkylhydroperoxidase/carboxymuconolactone decarboxylase family protein YurZ